MVDGEPSCLAAGPAGVRGRDRGLETLAGEIASARTVAVEALVTALDDIAMERALDRHAGVWLLGAAAGAGAAQRLVRCVPSRTALHAAPAAPPAAWSSALEASVPAAETRTPATARAALRRPRSPRPCRSDRPGPTPISTLPCPSPVTPVDHFAFGRADVVKSDGDRLHLRVHKDGRIREIALEMLKRHPGARRRRRPTPLQARAAHVSRRTVLWGPNGPVPCRRPRLTLGSLKDVTRPEPLCRRLGGTDEQSFPARRRPVPPWRSGPPLACGGDKPPPKTHDTATTNSDGRDQRACRTRRPTRRRPARCASRTRSSKACGINAPDAYFAFDSAHIRPDDAQRARPGRDLLHDRPAQGAHAQARRPRRSARQQRLQHHARPVARRLGRRLHREPRAWTSPRPSRPRAARWTRRAATSPSWARDRRVDVMLGQ